MSSQASGPISGSEENTVATSPEDDSAWENWRVLTADAYARFHERLLADRHLFPSLTDYALVDRARAAKGTFAWWWAAADEIQETTNSLNGWGMRLHEWGAWNQVLDGYDSDSDRWEVMNHFVEPVAFYCMLQPSSFSDQLAVVAESLLHQANQRVFPNEPDRLAQDEAPGKSLRRADRRKQLNRLGRHWSSFPAFRDAIRVMNGPGYEKATGNFRDLSAHSVAPRLMIGQVARAPRSIVPLQEMVQQPCGGYLPVDHPTKKGVQYAASAMEPLGLGATRLANLAEYQKALTAMRQFSTLVAELCARMDNLPKPSAA